MRNVYPTAEYWQKREGADARLSIYKDSADATVAVERSRNEARKFRHPPDQRQNRCFLQGRPRHPIPAGSSPDGRKAGCHQRLRPRFRQWNYRGSPSQSPHSKTDHRRKLRTGARSRHSSPNSTMACSPIPERSFAEMMPAPFSSSAPRNTTSLSTSLPTLGSLASAAFSARNSTNSAPPALRTMASLPNGFIATK